MKPDKSIVIAFCFVTAIWCCSTCFAQCEGGICAARIAPVARIVQRERIVVRVEASSNARPIVVNAAGRVLDVAARPFRRVWFRRNDRG